MTKEDFIKKYIYGIGNDALTDNQEAIDMAKDLDRYFTEQLRQYNAVRQSEQLSCGRNITTCVFYKDGGKCSNPEYCRDQTT